MHIAIRKLFLIASITTCSLVQGADPDLTPVVNEHTLLIAPPEPPQKYRYVKPDVELLPQSLWLKFAATKISSKAELQRIYQELYAQQLIGKIATINNSNKAELARYEEAKNKALKISRNGYSTTDNRFFDDSGNLWFFHGTQGSKGPNSAAKFSFPTPEHYSTLVEVYCLELNDACQKTTDTVKTFPAPTPPESHSKKAHREWLFIRTDGPCTTTLPYIQVEPIYPADELSKNIGGTVYLHIETDSCGFPLKVTVFKSSRNRFLDRAAIDAFKKSRLDIPTNVLRMPGEDRVVIYPVTFIPNPPRR
ncbi:MAG: energy transducer TonB [Arenimonas sp.]